MPGVFHAALRTDNAAWVYDSVTVFFISSWKLKFLAYLLDVHNVSLYHFICTCMLTVAVVNGRSVSELLRRRVHCATQAKRRETFLFSQECSAVRS
jgi:hypothetical protein